MIEEEEDKVDSDFDLDSSEGEQEHIDEGRALDKQIEKAEKRVRFSMRVSVYYWHILIRLAGLHLIHLLL